MANTANMALTPKCHMVLYKFDLID